jgi:hypothetical protein
MTYFIIKDILIIIYLFYVDVYFMLTKYQERQDFLSIVFLLLNFYLTVCPI